MSYRSGTKGLIFKLAFLVSGQTQRSSLPTHLRGVIMMMNERKASQMVLLESGGRPASVILDTASTGTRTRTYDLDPSV